jgi:hypothetical protein
MSRALVRDSNPQEPPRWAAAPALQRVETIGVEPVGGWWSSNTQWGKRFTGNLQARLDDGAIDLLSLQEAPGPPRTIGVQLYRSDKQLALGAMNGDAQCEVTYGGGGTSNTFLLDWCSGSGFTLVCNTVRLAIKGVQADANSGYSPLRNVILGATLGLNALNQSKALITTAINQPLASAASLQSAIPDFATGFQLGVDNGAFANINLAQLRIRFRSVSNSVIDSQLASEVAGALFSTSGLRIPSRAQAVETVNITGAAIRISHQFVLGI